MTRRFMFSILIGLFFLLPMREGRCDEPEVKDIPPGDDKIVPLDKGVPAPFSGQLYDPDTALRWSNWLLQYKSLLVTREELQKKVCDAEIQLRETQLAAEKKKYDNVTADYQKKLLEREEQVQKLHQEIDAPPFYRTVWFGAVLGVITTGALFGLGVWAATSAY